MTASSFERKEIRGIFSSSSMSSLANNPSLCCEHDCGLAEHQCNKACAPGCLLQEPEVSWGWIQVY